MFRFIEHSNSYSNTRSIGMALTSLILYQYQRHLKYLEKRIDSPKEKLCMLDPNN
jgi:hypothetical protein